MMRNVLRMVPVPSVTLMVMVAVTTTVAGGYAPGTGWTTTMRTAAAAGPQVNACGCYRDSTGSCFCGKKGKCDCPGDCEPKGCDEKRAKEIDREIQAETKRAQEAESKQRDESEASRKKAEEAADAEPAAPSGDSRESGAPIEATPADDDQNEVSEPPAKKRVETKKARRRGRAKEKTAR